MSGGNCGCSGNESNKNESGKSENNTENLITNIQGYFDKQMGGKKKKNIKKNKVGYRKMKLSGDESRGKELNRIINDQVSDIIGEVINEIIKLISDHPNEFKKIEPNEKTAKAYKAALWQMTKDQHKDLKSPYDVAVEMKKMVDVKHLKEIDVGKWIKKLEEHYASKQKKKLIRQHPKIQFQTKA